MDTLEAGVNHIDIVVDDNSSVTRSSVAELMKIGIRLTSQYSGFELLEIFISKKHTREVTELAGLPHNLHSEESTPLTTLVGLKCTLDNDVTKLVVGFPQNESNI